MRYGWLACSRPPNWDSMGTRGGEEEGDVEFFVFFLSFVFVAHPDNVVLQKWQLPPTKQRLSKKHLQRNKDYQKNTFNETKIIKKTPSTKQRLSKKNKKKTSTNQRLSKNKQTDNENSYGKTIRKRIFFSVLEQHKTSLKNHGVCSTSDVNCFSFSCTSVSYIHGQGAFVKLLFVFVCLHICCLLVTRFSFLCICCFLVTCFSLFILVVCLCGVFSCHMIFRCSFSLFVCVLFLCHTIFVVHSNYLFACCFLVTRFLLFALVICWFECLLFSRHTIFVVRASCLCGIRLFKVCPR